MFTYWNNIKNEYIKKWYAVNVISCKKIDLFNVRLSDVFTRYVYYPLFLFFVCLKEKGVFHIIDHSYAYLWMSIIYKETLIVTCHDLMPLKFPKNVWKIAHMLFYLNIKCLGLFWHIITDSESTRKDLIWILKINASKITMIPLAYDRSVFFAKNHETKGKKFTILLIWSNFYKNIMFALKWISIFKNKYSNTNFRILKIQEFTVEERSFIENSLSGIEVVEKIWMTNEEVWNVFRESDLLIFPSLYEWFWLPILEAFASWMNVITTKRWSLEEVWWDACKYVWWEDVNELWDAIWKIYTNEDNTNWYYIEKWTQQASKFDWSKTADLTLKIYFA